MGKYSRYFVMDEEIPVRLEERGNEVFGFNLYNSPYPVGKILVEGREITREEYDRFASELEFKRMT